MKCISLLTWQRVGLLALFMILILSLSACGNNSGISSGGSNNSGTGSGDSGSSVTLQQQTDFRQWLDTTTQQLRGCVQDLPKIQVQAQNAKKGQPLDDSALQDTITDCQNAVPAPIPASLIHDNNVDSALTPGMDFSSQAERAAQELDDTYNGTGTSSEAENAQSKVQLAKNEYASYLSAIGAAKQTYAY